MDFPTPFTPTMEITYGRERGRESVEGRATASISRRRSSELVGVRILRREDSIADWIFA